jgi:flagellum-specific ATP synthase
LTDLADKKELKIVRDTVALLSTYEKNRQMIEIGAYRPGSNSELDRVIKLVPEINKILCQDTEHHTPRAEAFRMLQTLLSSHGIK